MTDTHTCKPEDFCCCRTEACIRGNRGHDPSQTKDVIRAKQRMLSEPKRGLNPPLTKNSTRNALYSFLSHAAPKPKHLTSYKTKNPIMTTHYEEKSFCKLWNENREKVIKRDGGCVKCGNPNAKCVHHIVPAREFDDPAKEHALSNLVTVCQHSCHWELESMDTLKQRKYHPNFEYKWPDRKA